MANERDPIGVGWRFPFSLNISGGVSRSSDSANNQTTPEGQEQVLRGSMQQILGTANGVTGSTQGDRFRRRSFGCLLHEIPFEPNDAVTASLAKYYAKIALQIWEKRAVITKIDTKIERNNGKLLLDGSFTVRGTSVQGNFVYPFYVEGE